MRRLALLGFLLLVACDGTDARDTQDGTRFSANGPTGIVARLRYYLRRDKSHTGMSTTSPSGKRLLMCSQVLVGTNAISSSRFYGCLVRPVRCQVLAAAIAANASPTSSPCSKEAGDTGSPAPRSVDGLESCYAPPTRQA